MEYDIIDYGHRSAARIGKRQRAMFRALDNAAVNETRNSDCQTISYYVNVYDYSTDRDDADILAVCTPFEPRLESDMKFSYKVVDGDLAIIPKTGRNVISPGLVDVETSHHLCRACSDAFSYWSHFVKVHKNGQNDTQPSIPLDEAPTKALVDHSKRSSGLSKTFRRCISACQLKHKGVQPYPNSRDMPSAVVHHFNIASLFASVLQDCYLCQQLAKHLPLHSWQSPWFKKARLEMCWSDQNIVHFVATMPAQERRLWNYTNYFKVQMWDTETYSSSFIPAKIDHNFNTHVEMSTNRGSSTNSSITRDLAVQWLSNCQQDGDGKHEECNVPKGAWLPARLLDVERAKRTSLLHLVCSERSPTSPREGDYITLSHCWGREGSKELPLLKLENLLDRELLGIKLTALPKTFQDAVEIASWFKVRWLWVDCMCILQDSDTDWLYEAEMMSHTYKNALLNISADIAGEPSGGCFVERDPVDIIPLKIRSLEVAQSWWVTPHRRYIFENMREVPSFSRAWIHRERQLSRRVIHFTATEVFWECCGAKYISETFPGGAPFENAFNGDHKYEILALQQQQNVQAGQDIYKVYDFWDEACKNFSKKKLSKPTDMPVVLASLAREIGGMLPGDQYIEGLWQSTLPLSLLWRTDAIYYTSYEESNNNSVAPSWSWLSTSTRISVRSRRREVPIAVISEIKKWPKFCSNSVSLDTGTLKLTGFLRKIRIHDIKIVKDKPPPIFSVSVDEGRCVLGSSYDSYEGFLCRYDLDYKLQSSQIDCFCLLIAIEHNSNFYDVRLDTQITGLLIERIKGEDSATSFRRVGLINFSDLFALKMRYKIKPGCLDDNGAWKSLQKAITTENVKRKAEHQESGREYDFVDHTIVSRDIDLTSLYQYDHAGDFSWLEKLTTETITLI